MKPGQRHLTRLDQVPPWVKPGARVNYHSVLNGPVTEHDREIAGEPFLLGGHTACVFLKGKSGCVSVGALSHVPDGPAEVTRG